MKKIIVNNSEKRKKVLKSLNLWFFKNSKINIDELILNMKDDENYYKRIFLNYGLNNTFFILYFDKYLNSRFRTSKFDIKMWLIIFKELYLKTNQKSYYYIESKNYINDDLLEYNGSVKQNLLKLQNLNIVAVSDVIEFENTIDNNNIKNKELNSNIIIDEMKKVVPEKTIYWIEDIKKNIDSNTQCFNCDFFGNEKFILKTNSTEPTKKVDICFIFEYIDKDNKNYKILLDIIEKVISPYFTYSIYSLLSCLKNEHIKITAKHIKTCSHIFTKINEMFYGGINVIFGNNLKKYFKIEGRITDVINTFTESKNYFIMDDIYSTLPRKNKNVSEGLKILIDYLSVLNDEKKLNEQKSIEKNKIKEVNDNTEKSKYNIPNENIIYSYNKDYTFLNAFTVENDIIMVFIDQNGTKKYLIQNINMPIYIKFGNYEDNEFIDKKMTQVCYITKQQKSILENTLKKKMKSIFTE